MIEIIGKDGKPIEDRGILNSDPNTMPCPDDYDEMEEDEYIEDEPPTCGCPYCHCCNYTIAGESCHECTMGAHQG